MQKSKWLTLLVLAALLAAVFLPILFSGSAQIRQAETAMAAGNYNEAAVSYENAARLAPWRMDLLEQGGLAYMQAEDYPNAIRLYEKAYNAGALDDANWHFFGWAHWMNRDHPAALKIWQEGAAAHPTYALFYDALAMSRRELKDYLSERDALKKWVALEPESAQAHYRLGLILMLLEPEQAITDLLLASSLDPQFDPAAQTLRTALNLSAMQPDASQQMVTIGRALGLVNEWELSAAAFQNALELDDKNGEAWAWLGEAKQQTGKDGRAELDKALRLDSQSVIVRGLRGLYWNRQGKYSQALAEYLLAARIEPGNPAWQAEIGNARARLGDLTSAMAAYQRATELAPNETTYWRLLAVLCAENGIYVEEVGLPAAQKAVELAPADPAALDALGWSYLASGRYFTAEQTLLQVIEIDPNYLPAQLHLAMTYLSQGKRVEAFDLLSRMQEADPQGGNGQFAEQLLEQYFP